MINAKISNSGNVYDTLDRLFHAWQTWPYNDIYRSYTLAEQWWQKATTDISGVSSHHLDLVSFGARQLFDFFAPSNFAFINPDV